MIHIALMSYIEIDCTCLFLLLSIFVISSHKIEDRQSWIFYQLTLVFLMCVTLSDCVWALMDGHVIPAPIPLQYLINSAYYVFSTLTGSAWYFFVSTELGILQQRRMGTLLLMVAPLVATIVMILANCFVPCVFAIDADGHFIRGPLTLPIFLMPLFYMILATFHPLLRMFHKKNYAQWTRYRDLTFFALFSISSIVLHFFAPGTPLPSLGMTLALTLVFLNRQEQLISIDPLTKLNNRHQMLAYLDRKMESPDRDCDLYLLLLDLDHFKAINDEFGHVEGDTALIRTADVLRQVASVFGCFASRYGGDEFILIYETANESRVDALCAFIRQALAEASQATVGRYVLSASIGYAKRTPAIQHIPDLIALADRALYAAKDARDQVAS